MNKVSYDNLKGIEQKNGTMPPVNHLSDLMHKICSKYFWKNEKKKHLHTGKFHKNGCLFSANKLIFIHRHNSQYSFFNEKKES